MIINGEHIGKVSSTRAVDINIDLIETRTI